MSDAKGMQLLTSDQKVMTPANAARLLEYVDNADFLLEGGQVDEFVSLRFKLRLMAIGAVQYTASEVAPALAEKQPETEDADKPTDPDVAEDG